MLLFHVCRGAQDALHQQPHRQGARRVHGVPPERVRHVSIVQDVLESYRSREHHGYQPGGAKAQLRGRRPPGGHPRAHAPVQRQRLAQRRRRRAGEGYSPAAADPLHLDVREQVRAGPARHPRGGALRPQTRAGAPVQRQGLAIRHLLRPGPHG